MKKSKIAVFIDVENLTQWMKEDGAESLMADLAMDGQIIVRRAYGVWSKPNLVNFQSPLNQLGFELVHSFHPVSGKNSADIQLTVDAMDHALRPSDVDTIVLATGDSDFSPLFRRLREMGKEVVGIGPKSPLSECVKTSCSRYIYTDKPAFQAGEFSFDDAAVLVERILSTRTEPMPLTQLKQAMTNVDSAFDERLIGFSSFSALLKAIDSVEVFRVKGSATLWQAHLCTSGASITDGLTPATKEMYVTLLRHTKWRSVPQDLLVQVHKTLASLPPMDKAELVETLLERISMHERGVTAVDVRKALTNLAKAQLFQFQHPNDDQTLWAYSNQPDYLRLVDQAITSRIRSGCDDQGVEFNSEMLQQVLYRQYNAKTIAELIDQSFTPKYGGVTAKS
ncbi:MAG: hypothetical protein ACJAWL_000882 [Motiliproteus sp.]|jgi:hypothetical protein